MAKIVIKWKIELQEVEAGRELDEKKLQSLYYAELCSHILRFMITFFCRLSPPYIMYDAWKCEVKVNVKLKNLSWIRRNIGLYIFISVILIGHQYQFVETDCGGISRYCEGSVLGSDCIQKVSVNCLFYKWIINKPFIISINVVVFK